MTVFSRRLAEVQGVKSLSAQYEELEVDLDGSLDRAVNYVPLTGSAARGDTVVLNTTAVELRLGSGGHHFVWLNLRNPENRLTGTGHIMKLRYTPAQVRVLALEEEASPHHGQMCLAHSLDGMAVLVAELHSQLTPAVLTLQQEKPGVRVAYLMTDGGALPAYFSAAARCLRESGLLQSVITCGHAFGGDLEAVTVHSGLLAARHVVRADAAIVAMGPGLTGTGTPFGFSGLELGDNVNRVYALGGRAVAVPRISFADRRPRHQGLSHHTITALGRIALAPADLPLPVLPGEQGEQLLAQVRRAALPKRNHVFFVEGVSLDHLRESGFDCSTMGRSLEEDPAFFLAVVAAARHAAGLLQCDRPARETIYNGLQVNISAGGDGCERGKDR